MEREERATKGMTIFMSMKMARRGTATKIEAKPESPCANAAKKRMRQIMM